jgi:two-component system, chemotaxis family, chemotaxis protein CheY
VSWALLLVDDDDDVREELAAIFEARGFHTISASNGAEALRIAAEQGLKPDVIVLDLLMPVMDGQEFLERQPHAGLLADVPVIVLTAQPERAKDFKNDVHAVLEKPFRLPVLLGMVQDLCGSTRFAPAH